MYTATENVKTYTSTAATTTMRYDETIPVRYSDEAYSRFMTNIAHGLPISHAVNCAVSNCEIQQFTKYDTTYIRTVLTFADGSKESVECLADKADAYYGFTTCYAKHITKKFLNKNISDMADYWLITKPKREAEARAKADAQRAEEQRLAERDKKRREKYRIRMEAIRRKETYEAVKLAEEKYGVPADWSEK